MKPTGLIRYDSRDRRIVRDADLAAWLQLKLRILRTIFDHARPFYPAVAAPEEVDGCLQFQDDHLEMLAVTFDADDFPAIASLLWRLRAEVAMCDRAAISAN